MATLKIKTDNVVANTQDAYSRSRYTDAGWAGIARRLLREGFTPEQAEWVLKSKHMRWAADAANRDHSVTLTDFEGYVFKHLGGRLGYDRLRGMAMKDLGVETRRATQAPLLTGADLVGRLEGEDLAEAVDFVISVERGEGGDAEALKRRARALMDRFIDKQK